MIISAQNVVKKRQSGAIRNNDVCHIERLHLSPCATRIREYNYIMKTNKASARDKKQFKAKHCMRVSGRSVLLLQEIVNQKAKIARGE